ncbi:MAG: tyrosine-type recombinase/integrase [Halobacteriota archaeon]
MDTWTSSPLRAADRSGRRSPHTFRHSFAINSVRHGVDIRRLQQVLGHTSMNTTAVYLQFNDKDLHDVYASVPF